MLFWFYCLIAMTNKSKKVFIIIACAFMACAMVAWWLWPGAARVVNLVRADNAQQNVHLPTLSPIEKNVRLLILSPHLDDETLGAGGAIAQAVKNGARVRVVFCTNGDGSGATILGENFHNFRRHSYVEMAQMRQREAVRALQQLGIERKNIVFLGYPDGGTKAMWENWPKTSTSPTTKLNYSPYSTSPTLRAPYRGAQMLSDIVRQLREFRPTLILTTHPADTHVDHWAANAYAQAALQVLATEENATWARKTRVMGFLIHHGAWPLPHSFHPEARLVPPRAQMQQNTQWRSLKLPSGIEEQKRRALEEYGSQLLFTPHYLRAFVRRNELFGTTIFATPQGFQLRDERADTAPRAPRGTDIQLLSVHLSQQWNFIVQLDSAPNRGTTYELQLHAIVDGKVNAQRVQVLAGRSNALQVLAGAPQGTKARVEANALKISMPALTHAHSKSAALLISASTRDGTLLRDQTETALLEF